MRRESFGSVVAVLLACALVGAVELWLAYPRFSLQGVALIDDWWSVVVIPSKSAGEALWHLFVDFAPGPDGRFRPSVRLWSYLEWQLTGAPQSVAGSHRVQLARQTFFLEAMTVATAALVWFNGVRGRLRAPWLLLLAALPAAMVLGARELGPELFARSGPQEPGLLAETFAGGALLVLALRRWLTGPHDRSAVAAVAAMGAAGWVLLTLGLLEKEPAIAFAVLGPFIYVALDRTWRARGIIGGPLIRERAFQVLAFAIALPFVRLVVGILVSLVRGPDDSRYGSTAVRSGGLLSQSASYFSTAWESQRPLILAVIALFVVVVGLLAATWIRERTVPVLETGLAVTSVAFLALQSTGYDAAPRYALPTLVLLAMACASLLTRFGAVVRLGAAISVAAFFVPGVHDSKVRIDDLVLRLRGGEEAARTISAFNPGACPVYLASTTGAEAMSLPMVVGAAGGYEHGPGCAPRAAGVLLSGPNDGAVAWTNEAILRSCAGPGWKPVWTNHVFTISVCRAFRDGAIDGEPVSRILEEDRIVPGRSFEPRDAAS